MGVGDFVESVGNEVGGAVGASDLGSRVLDGLSQVDSWVTGDESRADVRARNAGYAAAAQQGTEDRDGIYSEQSSLQGQVRDGFDPTSISDFENFQGMGHAAMRTAADTMDEGAIRDSADTWRTLGGQLEDDFTEFQETVAASIANGWEGEAAGAASTTSARYADHGASLGPAFTLTGTKMEEAATGAGQTNVMVPPVVPFNLRHAVGAGIVNVVAGTGGPLDDVKAQSNAAEAARLDAVRVMTNVYTPVYEQADTGVPTYAGPASVTSPVDPAAHDRTPNPWHTDAGAGGATGSGAAAAGVGSAGYTPPGHGTSGAGGYGAGSGGAGTDSGGSGGSSGAGYGAGSSGAGGGAGQGAGTGAGGSSGAGQSGGSAAGGTAGAGRTGAGGTGGMGAGRGGRGEEGEHSTPSYLITEQHGSEIVGVLPPVSPPVIGA